MKRTRSGGGSGVGVGVGSPAGPPLVNGIAVTPSRTRLRLRFAFRHAGRRPTSPGSVTVRVSPSWETIAARRMAVVGSIDPTTSVLPGIVVARSRAIESSARPHAAPAAGAANRVALIAAQSGPSVSP